MAVKVWTGLLLAALTLLSVAAAEAEEVEKVLTLDHSNFTDTVSKHSFIVVQFYSPQDETCKALAPEYEKAASILSSHESPVVLAKVNVSDHANMDLVIDFGLDRIPSIKIVRKGGETRQDYKGPHEAAGIVEYIKKQLGPASSKIESAEDAAALIDENDLSIVGIFPERSGEEFENYIAMSEKLRHKYEFGHTLDAKYIPRGEPKISKPTLRLLKPYDELVMDSQDFKPEAMEEFIEGSAFPILLFWDKDAEKNPQFKKVMGSSNAKALLIVNFEKEYESYHPKYKEVATLYRGKGISFIMSDVNEAKDALKEFGIRMEQTPVLIVLKTHEEKYVKTNIEPDQIASWIKDYKDGHVKRFIKSQPIPESNDEPVKVVVRDTLEDATFNSGKHVLLEFYAPWCKHCKVLAPTLDELAIALKDDPDIVIAKFDITKNDVPKETFNVKGFPTLFLITPSGKVVEYDGDRSKEDFIEFIEEYRDKPAESTSETVDEKYSVKDEL